MRFKNLLFSHYDDSLGFPRTYRISVAVCIFDSIGEYTDRFPETADKAMESVLKDAILPCLSYDNGKFITVTNVELLKQCNFYDYYEIEVRIEEDNRRELEIKAEYFERENEKLRNQINELLFEKYESERFGE